MISLIRNGIRVSSVTFTKTCPSMSGRCTRCCRRPAFVGEFILDHTLEPAMDEFGLAGLRVIDPVCGSGTFLLDAFRRLLERGRRRLDKAGPWDVVSECAGIATRSR